GELEHIIPLCRFASSGQDVMPGGERRGLSRVGGYRGRQERTDGDENQPGSEESLHLCSSE
ncbi:MAG: hypothetical protein L0241_15005, partial [Planctomycetia bacterium]|nr:hypothetical protein [Planctomycetia bacterium]